MSGSAPRCPTRMTLLTPPAMCSSFLRQGLSRLSDSFDGDQRWTWVDSRSKSASMFRQLRVAVVIPAYNEARAIAEAVDTIPALVDAVVVVDDASLDDTAERA